MSNIINITYHANYNGCTIDDVPEDDKYEQVCDDVSGTLFDHCDEDGYYCGNDHKVIKVCTAAVKEVYGDDVEVIVNIDQHST